MKPQEELIYLTDLLMQAALWRTNDSGNSPIELEVMERVKRLRKEVNASHNETCGHGEPISEPKKVRVKHEDGHYKWHNREECERVPMGGNRFKWKLRYLNCAGQAVLDKVED